MVNNVYKLKCLYPSTNRSRSDKYFNVEVKADKFELDISGSIKFYNRNHDIIAIYPTQYTIIEKIIYDE